MMTAHRQTSKARLRPRAKTSSERGRKFCALQREREEALGRSVASLGEEVESLQRSRQLHLETWMNKRFTSDGSCARAIREFFTLFYDGFESDVVPRNNPYLTARLLFKERYVRFIYDPDVVVADRYGLQAAIDQWRRYTVFHDRFHLEMGHITTSGPSEDPTFALHAKVTVRDSQATLEYVFPYCLEDTRLAAKFLHQQLT